MVQQFLLYRWLLSMAAVNGTADSAVPLWVGLHPKSTDLDQRSNSKDLDLDLRSNSKDLDLDLTLKI